MDACSFSRSNFLSDNWLFSLTSKINIPSTPAQLRLARFPPTTPRGKVTGALRSNSLAKGKVSCQSTGENSELPTFTGIR